MADEKGTKPQPVKAAEKPVKAAEKQEEAKAPKTTYIVNGVEVDPNGKPVK